MNDSCVVGIESGLDCRAVCACWTSPIVTRYPSLPIVAPSWKQSAATVTVSCSCGHTVQAVGSRHSFGLRLSWHLCVACPRNHGRTTTDHDSYNRPCSNVPFSLFHVPWDSMGHALHEPLHVITMSPRKDPCNVMQNMSCLDLVCHSISGIICSGNRVLRNLGTCFLLPTLDIEAAKP